MDSTRHRHSTHVPSGSNSQSMVYNPWRHHSNLLLSPAPNRRSSAHKHENLFGNIYNSSREAFFPAF